MITKEENRAKEMENVRTYVEEGNTIRVFNKVIGNKQVIRKFYLKYVVFITDWNKSLEVKEFSTLTDAVNELSDQVLKISEEYQLTDKDWLKNKGIIQNHVEEAGTYICITPKVKAELYVCEKAGDSICEIII